MGFAAALVITAVVAVVMIALDLPDKALYPASLIVFVLSAVIFAGAKK